MSVVLLLALALPTSVGARPRSPLPPYPEVKIGSWDFDEAYYQLGMRNAPAVVPGTDLVESFSGYALRREGAVVTPFVIPGLGDDGRPNITLEQGAIRFWFRPTISPQGDYARLVELVSLGDTTLDVVWSVYHDGSTIYWSGQGREGPTDFLRADLPLQLGQWYLLTLSYTPTNTALSINGGVAAVGWPFQAPPAATLTNLGLVLGSTVEGRHAAQGQFDALATFAQPWQEFPSYYSAVSKVAALGPVTEAEDEARQQAMLAWTAELAGKRRLAPEISLTGGGGPGLQKTADTNLSFLPPVIQVTNTTNILLTLHNANTNKSYDILSTYQLRTSNTVWSSIAVTGRQGQITFAIPLTNWVRFFRAKEGSDWDGDGIPNSMDADPYSSNLAAPLIITILSPTNRANIY